MEAFNNAFRSRYLKLRHDKTVFSLVQVLTDIVFPEQAREYTIAVAQQTNAYRVSRYSFPDFLQDRPHLVQAECLANIQGANKYEKNDIKSEGDGKFHITERRGDKAVKTVLVNIPGGICGCSYFQKSLIPCKHMFAIFTHFPSDWSWKNFPPSLTESSYMTLDIAVLHSDEVTEVLDDSNLEQTTVEERDTSNETPDPPAKQTNAHQLLLAQRQARDALSKCISVIFSLENLEAIQSATAMANQLYCQLIQAAHPGKMPEELPSFPLLAKAEVDRCRSSTKYQPRVGLRRTRPNQKRTITAGKGSCSKRIKIDDPLSLVQRLHEGHKAIQCKQQKLPPQPRQMAPVSKIIRKAKRYQIRISKTTNKLTTLCHQWSSEYGTF